MESYNLFIRNLDKSNQQIINDLVADGADISKPIILDYFFTFNSRHNSKLFLKVAAKKGYTGSSSFNRLYDSWEVHLSNSCIINLTNINQIINTIKFLGQKYDGYFDGWIATLF